MVDIATFIEALFANLFAGMPDGSPADIANAAVAFAQSDSARLLMPETIQLIVFCFLICSVAGWVFEVIMCSVSEGYLVKRGFFYGPYCPIYGFGAAFDLAVLGSIHNPFAVFALGALLAWALEYVTSYALEKAFNARWWDYSHMRFNLNGRICLAGGVVFGIFAVFLVFAVQPLAVVVLSVAPEIINVVVLSLGLVVFFIDAVASVFQQKKPLLQKAVESIPIVSLSIEIFALKLSLMRRRANAQVLRGLTVAHAAKDRMRSFMLD